MIPILVLFEGHLTVTDLDRAVEFYRGVLGLRLAHVVPARQAAFFWIGPAGNAMLGLWGTGSGPQRMALHTAFRASLAAVVAAPSALRSAARRPTLPGNQPTSRWSPPGCRPRPSSFTIRTVTCWSTSPCSQTRHALKRASFRGENGNSHIAPPWRPSLRNPTHRAEAPPRIRGRTIKTWARSRGPEAIVTFAQQ